MEHHIRTIGTVNFRTGPGTSNSIIQNLAKGTVLHVLEVVPGVTWYRARIVADGREGYISSLPQYVEDFTPDWEQKVGKVLDLANSYLGTPYVFGSTRHNDTSFDCSDLVQYCYEKALGIKLSGDSRSQSKEGVAVDYSQYKNMRSGDLVFFDTNADGIINHVAMYVYPNKLLHTYSTTAAVYDQSGKQIKKNGGGVTWSDYVDGSSWRKKTVGVRRIVQ